MPNGKDMGINSGSKEEKRNGGEEEEDEEERADDADDVANAAATVSSVALKRFNADAPCSDVAFSLRTGPLVVLLSASVMSLEPTLGMGNAVCVNVQLSRCAPASKSK